MEGVTHPLFRKMAAERGGLDLLCTEFVRVTDQPLNPNALRSVVVKAPEVPLSVQIMGNTPGQMADAARYMQQGGADVVDVNLGCPTPRAARKGVGAAMLKQPELLHSVMSALRQAVSGLLSAKIRAGFDDAESVIENANIIQDCGADFIAVHPRRRCDFYQGVADWRIIARLKQELSIPVIGNGDVWYAEDAVRMQRETGCDAVMIGRPALRNPWIFRQIQQLRQGSPTWRPSGQDVVAHLEEVARRYRTEMPCKRQGPLGPFKELLRWLARAVNDEGQFGRQALRLGSIDAILKLSAERLGPLRPEQLDLGPTGELGLERSGSALRSENG